MNKLSGVAFKTEIRQLQRQISRLSAQLEEEQQRWEWQHEREQVLLDLAAHQELILSILQQENTDGVGSDGPARRGVAGESAASMQLLLPTLASATGTSATDGSSNSRRLWSASNSPNAAGGTSIGSSSNSGNFPSSYVAGMLRSITPAQAEKVQDLTPDQCRQKFSEMFSHLVVLTEMVSRHQQHQEQHAVTKTEPVAAEPQQIVGMGAGSATKTLGPLTAPAATATGMPPTGATCHRSGSRLPSSKNSRIPADLYGKDPVKDMQALEQLVDELVCFALLGMLHNWLPFYHVSIVQHIANGIAPAEHYLRVVKRLQLSEQQRLHLKIAIDEYNRLCMSAQAAATDMLTKSGSLLEALRLYIAAEEKMLHESGASKAAAAAAAVGPMFGMQSTGSQTCAAADPGLPGSSAVSEVVQISDRPVIGSGLYPSSSASAPYANADPIAPAAALTTQPAAAAAAAGATGSAGAAGTKSKDRPQQWAGQQSMALESLAQQHLLRLHVNTQMVCIFVLNTLTRLQIAELLVSSWPILPILPAVAEAAAQLHKDQTQQQDAAGNSRLGILVSLGVHQHQQQRRASLRQQQMQWLRNQQQLLQKFMTAPAAGAAAMAGADAQRTGH